MQRESSTQPGQGKEHEMTRFEIVQCTCGHEWVRPREARYLLPCGKCGSPRLSVRNLFVEPATA